MIQVPGYDNMHDFSKIYKQIEEELGALFKPPHAMEFENMDFPFLLYHLKKNYIYGKWTCPDAMAYIQKSGFLKRDRCQWVHDVINPVMDAMIKKQPETLVPIVTAALKRLSDNQVPPEELKVSCSLKDLSEYKGSKDNLVQLRVAQKIELRHGARPPPGSRLSYVIVKGAGPNYARGETIPYVKEKKIQVDLIHYLDSLSSILEVVTAHHTKYIDVPKLIAKCRADIRRHYMRSDPNSLGRFFKMKK